MMTLHDTNIKCKCGKAAFEQKTAYTYSKEKDRLGEYLKKQKAFNFLVCIYCGEIHPLLIDKERIIEAP